MNRRFVCALAALLLMTGPVGRVQASLAAAHAPVLRALLVACDTFVTEESLAPSARGNVETMERILRGDMRGYRAVTRAVNRPLDGASFSALVQRAFLGATENDISFFYISTHGIPTGRADADFTLLLSDGESEYPLTARELKSALERIPGEKVVCVDACNSGMLLNRGTQIDHRTGFLAGPGMQVITSSSGRELSYFWSSQGREGGSYLTLALEYGLTAAGGFEADGNRDGAITMGEVQRHLFRHYGPSTAQMYPTQGDFVLLRYDRALPGARRGLISGLVFDETVLKNGENDISFSYTLNRPAHLQYQIVYEENGAWQFDKAQLIEEPGDAGPVRPGRIERSIRLQGFEEGVFGYALVMIVLRDGEVSTPLSATLISVQQDDEEETPIIFVGRGFSPENGEELSVFVGHEKPCSITVYVRNEQGDVAATPLYEHMSRPQHLTPPGTLFFWRGVDDAGKPLPKGGYSLQAVISMGDSTTDVFSRAFSID